jgi:rubredoxin
MATMKLFKCMNDECLRQDQGRFYRDTWVCPRCGISMEDPKFGRLILRMVLIHYDPPTKYRGIHHGYRACDHAMPICVSLRLEDGSPNPYQAGTAVPSAVTCPECMKSEEYLTAMLLLDD